MPLLFALELAYVAQKIFAGCPEAHASEAIVDIDTSGIPHCRRSRWIRNYRNDGRGDFVDRSYGNDNAGLAVACR